MDHDLNKIERMVNEMHEAVKRRGEPGGASSNGNVVRLEGAGSIWNGIAIGLSIAGVIAGMVWISFVASNTQVSVRQAEAYRAAVYVVAPKFAEEVDKELERQKEREPK
ncbi:hypothetical protein [Stenotrophomonas geniculata]|uniref:Uncharacterized protein n=1 Tax=Stenotrophomonas geniculata TaxID=86188 RepID=A0ABW1MYD8_9GAMM|nr:hypothetical protein [Stenotrophomonas geniculata]MDC7800303.1 hypothetical protein [Stenotrophomonas geniculata]